MVNLYIKDLHVLFIIFHGVFRIFLISISWSIPGGMFSVLPINIPSTSQFLVGSIKLNPTKPDGTTWAGNHVHALRYLWNSTLGEQKALHRVRGPDARAVSGVMENVSKNLCCFRGPPKIYLQLKSTWNHLDLQVLAGRRCSVLGALQRGAWQVAGPVEMMPRKDCYFRGKMNEHDEPSGFGGTHILGHLHI